MGRLIRWVVAWTVTIGACLTVTWVAGAVVLPHLMKSPDTRWVVASGLGVAAGALAALWAIGFATREASAAVPDGKGVTAAGVRSIAVGGDVSGTASTGSREVAVRRRAVRGGGERGAGSGQVTASGPNSIAVGGDLSGNASTGDDVGSSEA
jgi:hypothetical protein